MNKASLKIDLSEFTLNEIGTAIDKSVNHSYVFADVTDSTLGKVKDFIAVLQEENSHG